MAQSTARSNSIETATVYFLRYRFVGRFLCRLSFFRRAEEADTVYLQYGGDNYRVRIEQGQPKLDLLLRHFYVQMYDASAFAIANDRWSADEYLQTQRELASAKSNTPCREIFRKAVCRKFVSPETSGELWAMDIGQAAFDLADHLRSDATSDAWDYESGREIGSILLETSHKYTFRLSWFIVTESDWHCDFIVVCGHKLRSSKARQVHMDMLGYMLDTMNKEKWPESDISLGQMKFDASQLTDMEMQWPNSRKEAQRDFFTPPKRLRLPSLTNDRK
jgi:hypothetical protein